MQDLHNPGKVFSERHSSVLADVSHALSASLDEQETISTLAGRLVPELADYCIIDVFEEEGGIRRPATARRERGGPARHQPDPPGPGQLLPAGHHAPRARG